MSNFLETAHKNSALLPNRDFIVFDKIITENRDEVIESLGKIGIKAMIDEGQLVIDGRESVSKVRYMLATGDAYLEKIVH